MVVHLSATTFDCFRSSEAFRHRSVDLLRREFDNFGSAARIVCALVARGLPAIEAAIRTLCCGLPGSGCPLT